MQLYIIKFVQRWFIVIQYVCNSITCTFTYWGTCIEYVTCSFLQNPVQIPVATKLRLKATDQDTEIDAEINYEMIRGMKCICIYVINIDIYMYHHVNKCVVLCKYSCSYSNWNNFHEYL
jgi:hypothetical protein